MKPGQSTAPPTQEIVKVVPLSTPPLGVGLNVAGISREHSLGRPVRQIFFYRLGWGTSRPPHVSRGPANLNRWAANQNLLPIAPF